MLQGPPSANGYLNTEPHRVFVWRTRASFLGASLMLLFSGPKLVWYPDCKSTLVYLVGPSVMFDNDKNVCIYYTHSICIIFHISSTRDIYIYIFKYIYSC